MTLLIIMSSGDLTITQAYYNGTTYNNSIIPVGINDHSVLEIYDTTLGSVGIQYSIGNNYE